MKINRMTAARRAVLCFVGFGVIAVTGTASGQEQGSSRGAVSIEEIVVTARKRDESLMEIPTAVTAFSFDEMDRRGFTSLEQISDATAGMNFSNMGGQIPGRYNEAVRFRGMNTNQTAPSQQIATVFVDGVYFPGGLQGVDFSNVERVEVINGPQSATFGRSTFAGAVNIVTKTPGFDYAGRASIEVADFGTYDNAIAHEGALIDDKLAYRVSARQYGTNGQYRSNADGGRLGEEMTRTFQASLYAQPTDNFSAKMRWYFSQDDDGSPAALFLGSPMSTGGDGSVNAGTNCFRDRPEERANGAVADYYCGRIPQVDVDRFIQLNTTVTPFAAAAFAAPTYTPIATGVEHLKVPGVPVVNSPGLKRTTLNYSLNMDYDITRSGWFDGFAIASLTGYGNTKVNWVRDMDLTGFDASMSQDPGLYEFWSQELRLESPGDQRLRWSLGYSFFDVDYLREGNLGMSVSGLDAACVVVEGVCVPPPNVGGISDFPSEGGTTHGIFGALGFDITERVTLDFEWRFQSDKITQDDRTTPGVDFSQTFDSFLPRVTLSFHPEDNSTIWGTYSKGNMPGFFNTDIVALSQAEFEQVVAVLGDVKLFNDEETLINYEIGWKKQLFNDRLFLSLVGYRLEWEDLKTRQNVTIILDTGTERTLNVQLNAGNAAINGVELTGRFAFTDKLSGQFNFEQVDGEYGLLQCGFSPFQRPQFPGNTFGPRDCSGKVPARYPEKSGSLSLAWVDNLAASRDWEYFVRGEAVYTGKAYTEEANFAWYGKFWRVNLRGGFEKEGIRIEGFVENLLDDDSYLAGSRWSDFTTGVNQGFLFSQGISLTPASKRLIGIKAIYEF